MSRSRLSRCACLLLCVPALLAAGCDDSSQEFNAGNAHARVQPYVPPSTPPPLLPSAAPPASDPLAAGGDALSGGGDLDPLASGGDSLSKSSDPMNGIPMPTDHSHWLVAEIQNAQVTVQLDGAPYSSALQTCDRDITMKLHKGTNTITIHYVPHDAESSAQIKVLESEHDPPIPPLVNFSAQPLTEDPNASIDAKPQPITKTFFFYAR